MNRIGKFELEHRCYLIDDADLQFNKFIRTTIKYNFVSSLRADNGFFPLIRFLVILLFDRWGLKTMSYDVV